MGKKERTEIRLTTNIKNYLRALSDEHGKSPSLIIEELLLQHRVRESTFSEEVSEQIIEVLRDEYKALKIIANQNNKILKAQESITNLNLFLENARLPQGIEKFNFNQIHPVIEAARKHISNEIKKNQDNRQFHKASKFTERNYK